MDFFVDGGLRKLFFDLDETHIEPTKSTITVMNTGIEDLCNSALSQTFDKCTQNSCSYKNMPNNNLLQENLSCPLNTDFNLNAAEEYDDLHNLFLTNTELADWEDKFLDNFIEIPKLTSTLPDLTPLCTESCVKFIKGNSENLCLLSPKEQGTVHEMNKTYSCYFGDCRKIYAKPAHLKAHLRRHMGDKPYICTWPQCKWKFSRSDELARHKRSHLGIKPYCCDFCSKCFARSDHLTKHRRVHEKRLLAASKAGKTVNDELASSILTIRPGRKKHTN